MSDGIIDPAWQLSGFELQRRLGAGGMAEVYLAKKRGAEGTFKQLVVKRILPCHSASRRFRHMFVEEAQLATRLNHPNIVQVYEFSDHSEQGLMLSMEYVEGIDLSKLARAARKQDRRLDPWISSYIATEVAKGLHYAHERKDEGGLPLAIVHRDVSPQNILISYGGVVKIADFGIASANLFREEAGVLKGKFGYMSPEQARGEKVDRRSDVYALGVVLYELLAGRSPYGPLKDTALADAVRLGAVRPPSTVVDGIPQVLEDLVMRAVARVPADRFATAREMAQAIARALHERQQLVDSNSVEELIVDIMGPPELIIGAAPGPALEPEPEVQQTLAAVRKPRTSASAASATGPEGTSRGSERIVREVRHVAVIAMRLHGFDKLQRLRGDLIAKRTLSSARSTLDDIAFKRGAVWSWESDTVANAVVGLMAKPGRAPTDAGMITVDIHDFLASLSEDLPCQLQASLAIVRGIASGERDGQGHLINHVLHQPASYLAETLGNRAEVDTTWVAGGVYRLVRREFHWAEGATISLDEAARYNAPARLRVHALVRPVTAEEQLVELALSPTDLVGRDAEKADLQAAYHRAVYHPDKGVLPPPAATRELSIIPPKPLTGELLVRVIVGEMGIGKTALVDAFVEELPDECRVFRVDCSPVNIELPYAALGDLLREVTGINADDSFEQAEQELRTIIKTDSGTGTGTQLVSTLASLVTGRQLQLRDDDAADQHHELIVLGVRVICGALASVTPIVIVIDGLQWADRSSLGVLQQVLERQESLPILMLLVTRPDERVNRYVEGLVFTELGDLEPDQQVQLVQTRLGVHEGVREVVRELLPRVGGNPYFLLEMVDALLERGGLEIVEHDGDHEGMLVRHEQLGESFDALPQTIEQLVGNRLSELPGAEHDVVDWLAVAGGPLSESDLLALARLADDEAIVRLCARGLCDHKAHSIDFRHPLARDVAYHALEPVQRTRMHRRLGEHLSTTPLSQGLSAAIVAQHLERGKASQQAADLYLEAAAAARGAHQTRLGLRYYRRALELLPAGDSRRLPAHEALEQIHRYLGEAEERRRHLAALRRMALESRQARWLALALVRSAQLAMDEGALDKGLPLARQAADMARFAKTPEVEVEALIILCELLRDSGDVNGALETSERALRVASCGGVPCRARADVLRAKGVLSRRAGRLHAAVEAHAEAIAILRSAGARRSEARVRNALGFALFALGRYEDTIAMCLSSLAIDVMIGGRLQLAKTLANVGMSYARLGDTAHGLGYLARAREAHDRYDDWDARVDTLLVTTSVLIERGDLEPAARIFEDACAWGSKAGNVYDQVHERIVAALLARAAGDPLAAATHASRARQLAEGQALVSYHVYATAIEAAARVDAAAAQAGILLATTALGAVEAMEGSEYGVEVRSLCCDAMLRGLVATGAWTGSPPPMAVDVCRRSLSHVEKLRGYIRDPQLRVLFCRRPPVRSILNNAAHVLGAVPPEILEDAGLASAPAESRPPATTPSTPP